MSDPEKPPRRRRLFLKAVRWTAIAIGSLVALALIALTVALSYLKPERLTPLVNRYASEYLLADVSAGRVELKFWSTFPRLELTVDSLTVDSRALEGLGPEEIAAIPADARRLIEAERLTGALDIPALLAGRIHIHEVEITGPRVNIVSVTPERANYLIMPPSDEPEPTADEPLSIPEISIDRFAITGDAPIRYISVADTTDITVTLRRTGLTGPADDPAYTLDIAGSGKGVLGSLLSLEETAFGLNGRIDWAPAAPLRAGMRDFRISVENLAVTVDVTVDATAEPVIESLRLKAEGLPVADAIALIPAQMRGELDRIATDLRIDLEASLTEPFRPATDSIPSAKVSLGAKGSLAYGRMRPFDIEAVIEAVIDGHNPDNSTLRVNLLRVIGHATGFKLSADVATPLSDPAAKGRFEGGVSFDALPRRLYDRLGITLRGLLTAETDFRLRASDLSPKRFHRLRLDGTGRLRRFHATTPDSALDVMTDGATLRFGTASTLALPQGSADSLLTVSLIVDTLSAAIDRGELTLAASALRAGIGTRNVAASTDTSQINPIGARFSAGRISARSLPDSVTARLRDITAQASLTRFNGNARSPRLGLNLDAGSLRYTDPANRASLRRAHFDLAIHLRSRDTTGTASRRAARLDSLRTLYPGLTDDSIRALQRHQRRLRREADSLATAAGERLDLEVDRSLARRLRRLDLRGSLTAAGGRLMSRYFPLRSRLNGLGMRFTADSLMIDSARMSVGRSHLSLTGAVTGISRALTSSSGNLKLDFNIYADTVDVNQITDAVFAGADFAANKGARPVLTDAAADDDIDASLAAAVDTVQKAAIIIPSNIEAELTVRADRVRYADLWLRNFRGNLAVHDGALALDRLSGSTDIGSLNLTALYEAPDTAALRFSVGMIVDRLQLNRFLAMMPQLDSIMPLLRDVDGVVDAEIALTSELDQSLDLRLPTLDAMVRLSGDSLVLIDSETFATIGKWLMFKDRRHNVIDHMDVELMVRDSRLDLYPFMFDVDRYRLGVSGANDLDLNLDYHIAVLKSPLPFRFGINIKGTPDDMKIRVGRARFDEKKAYAQRQLTDTVRVNLLSEISDVFRRGVKRGRASARLGLADRPADTSMPELGDTISRADSLLLIREGLIDTTLVAPAPQIPR